MFRKKHVFALIFLAAALCAASCSSPEEKKMKFFDKGKLYYEQSEWTNARLELKNALQIDPKFAEAYYLLGMTELKLQNIRGAYSSLSKAAELSPEHIDAQLQLGRLFLAAKAPQRAMEKADVVLEIDSENAEALRLKSSVHLADQNTGEAKGILNDLLQKGETTPETYLLLASAYLQESNAVDAENTLMQGISHNQGSVELKTLLAGLYRRLNRLEDASSTLKQLMESDPDNTSFTFQLAQLYWDMGKNSDALALLEKIIASDPVDDDARIAVAGFYASKDMSVRALELLNEGIKSKPEGFALRFALSELYLNTSKPDKAIETLQECLALEEDQGNPDIIRAKNSLAGLYFDSGRIEESERLVTEVINASPKSVDAHFIKGKILLTRDDGVNAVSEFRTVTFERPGFIPGHIHLAQAHAINNEYGLATDTLKSALENNPDSRDLQQALIRLYVMKQDFDKAQAQLVKILEANPLDYANRINLADLYYTRKNYDEAEAEYRKLTVQEPRNGLAFSRLGKVYSEKGDLKKAVSILEKGYGSNLDDLNIIADLCEYYIRDKRIDKAMALCTDRTKKDPNDAFSYNLIGKIHILKKQYNDAENAFNKVIAIKPTWGAPHQNLAQLFVIQGKYDEAVNKYRMLIEKAPKNQSSYLSLGQLYEVTGNFAEAISLYEKAIELFPDSWVMANNLAFLLCEHSGESGDKLSRALEIAEKYHRTNPEEVSLLDTLGWIHYRSNNMDKAFELIGRAIEIRPEASIINYHMGMILLKTGRIEEAKQRLETALAGTERFSGRQEAAEILKGIKG